MVFWDLAAAAASSIFVLILLCALGAALAIYPKNPRPILHPDARRDTGSFCIYVAIPALAFASIGATVHWDELKEVWDLLLWCFVVKLVGALMCGLATTYLRLDGEFKAAFCLAGTFGNSGSLPLIMMGSLCYDNSVLQYMENSDICVQNSYAYIMLYVACWQIVLFGFAWPLFKRYVAALGSNKSSGDFQSASVPSTPVIFNSPQLIEVGGAVPTIISCETLDTDEDQLSSASEDVFELRISEFLSRASPLGLASHVIDDTLDDSFSDSSSRSRNRGSSANDNSIHISNVGSSSSSHSNIEVAEQSVHGTDGVKTKEEDKMESFGSAILKSMQAPPIVASLFGLVVGVCKPLSTAIFSAGGEGGFWAGIGRATTLVGEIGVGLSVMLMASALAYSEPKTNVDADKPATSETATKYDTSDKTTPFESSDRPSHQLRVQPRVSEAVALALVRLVFMPGCGCALVLAAARAGAFASTGPGGLRALLVMVEWSVPPAQNVIVMLSASEYHGLAQRLASMYLVVYPLSILTLTAWTSLALYIVTENIWETPSIV